VLDPETLTSSDAILVVPMQRKCDDMELVREIVARVLVRRAFGRIHSRADRRLQRLLTRQMWSISPRMRREKLMIIIRALSMYRTNVAPNFVIYIY
jgi:hypothetical protein